MLNKPGLGEPFSAGLKSSYAASALPAMAGRLRFWRSGHRRRLLVIVALLSVSAALVFPAPTLPPDLLCEGFDHMYNLAFPDAHRCFQQWERAHPQDPSGPVFDAAAYLFSEFDRLHILQSTFFVDDQKFSSRRSASPDAELRKHFDQALARGKDLADAGLKQDPHDKDALFASVMRLGLQGDYDALIDKQYFRALGEIKEGRQLADELLRLHPDCYDAYIAVGVENYLLSLKPAPIRWLLHATGAQTDKATGIANLKLTAAKGKYLQPYAELLLAVAALRDKNNVEAKRLLSDLARRFPQNRLYREELQKVQ